MKYINYRLTRLSIISAVTTLIFVMLFLLLLIGCSKDEEVARKEIHFVTWKPNIPGVQEEIIKYFEAEHPDIKVVREIGPHSSTAFHDLLTQKLKNKSEDVDVFLMDVIWPPEFAAAGWAMSLDEMFPESEQDKFLNGTILANIYKDKIYGVPLFIDSGMLYYRKDLLEKYGFKPPETWQNMVEKAQFIVSQESKEGNELYGFSGQFKQYEGLVCDMLEYILSNGGEILNSKTGKSELTQKPAIEAVEFVRQNIIRRAAPPGVLTYQEPESLDVFIQGKAVFHRNWPYAWEVSNNPERSFVAEKVGITRLPHFKDNKSYSTIGGWQMGISRYSKNKEAAWAFVKFYTSKEIQKLLALKTGRAPTRKELYSDIDVVKAHPHFVDMQDVFLTAYTRPRTPLYPAVSNVLQRYFSKAITDSSVEIEKEALAASREIDRIISMTQ